MKAGLSPWRKPDTPRPTQPPARAKPTPPPVSRLGTIGDSDTQENHNQGKGIDDILALICVSFFCQNF